MVESDDTHWKIIVEMPVAIQAIVESYEHSIIDPHEHYIKARWVRVVEFPETVRIGPYKSREAAEGAIRYVVAEIYKGVGSQFLEAAEKLASYVDKDVGE